MMIMIRVDPAVKGRNLGVAARAKTGARNGGGRDHLQMGLRAFWTSPSRALAGGVGLALCGRAVWRPQQRDRGVQQKTTGGGGGQGSETGVMVENAV